MTDEPQITAAGAMRRNLAPVAPIPQHISAARALEVMQTAEVRQQRGSNEVFHPSVGGPTAAQAMRQADAEQDRHADLMNAPTAAQVMQAEIEMQRRRIWFMAGTMDKDEKPQHAARQQPTPTQDSADAQSQSQGQCL